MGSIDDRAGMHALKRIKHVDSRDIGERRDGVIGTAAPRYEALKRFIINRCGRRVTARNHELGQFHDYR